MTETTEPTREQIVEWLATHFAPASIDDERAVLRMALRTLDSEAQLESCMQVEACSRAFNDLAIRERDTARAKLAAMTERAELAETLLGASNAAVDALRATTSAIGADLRAIRDAAMTHAGEFMHAGETAAPAIERMATALREATERAEKAERDLAATYVAENVACRDAGAFAIENDRLRTKLSNMHRRAQLAENPTTHTRCEATFQRKRADWWRDQAKRLGWTPDYPELREDPPSDARLDCESSSLLLLSTWARRVMMRPKNRAKGATTESVEELLAMAREEIFEASDAIHAGAPTDYILAELGDAAAIIGFAMREIEKRRKA